MKKRALSMVIALLLITSMAAQPSYAARANATSNDTFYQELAELLSEEDDANYFDEMELQIGNNTLTIDGEVQTLDVAPEIVNSRTMLPIRAIAEATGATVDWVQKTATVVIESAYGDEISCTIGSDSITVNDVESEMDVSPYVKDGRTYLPLRAVSEALELEVEWDSSTSKITLTAPYQSARILALSDHLNLDGLTPESVITDGNGLWVIQFASPTEAKEGAEVLSMRGFTVEPDYYIPPIDDDGTYAQVSQSDSHYSWGAVDCGFDGFINKNSQFFTKRGVVAVVDTGVDASHPFLSGRVITGYDFLNGGNGTADGNSHGTHVAGTIIDCVGSAPVNIMPIRVLNNQGSGTNIAVVAGITYAANQGADVINLSLGGGHSEIFDNAVSYAIGKGCVVVASAGNENTTTAESCPAHITTGGTLVVSAGDSSHNKASFSNYGSSVDLMAPGVSIRAAVPGGSYALKSGTSMAAPHVAAAAVLIDLAWGSALSPAEIEAKVRTSTTYGSWTNQTIGCGFLDLSKAEAPRPAPTPSVSLAKRTLDMSIGEKETLTANVIPSGTGISWSSNTPSVATVSNNGVVSAVGSGTASITATISVNGRNYSDACAVTVGEPSISLAKKALSLSIGDRETLTARVSPSGAGISWSSNAPNVVAVSNGGTVSAVGSGSASITATITVNGKTYSDACTITVGAPTIKLSQHSLSMTTGDTQTLTVSTMPVGQSVSWRSSDTSVVNVSNGKIQAIGVGSAVIIAEFRYSGQTYSDNCAVTVQAPAEKPPVNTDWSAEKLPELAGYTIETKTQFRSRSKETTTSTQPTLAGWTQYDKKTEYGAWGPWSDWQDGNLFLFNDDETREIENRNYETSRTRYYDLYYYKYWNTNYNKWYYTYSSSMGGTKYTATARADECTKYKSYDGHQAYTYNGHDLWWIERAYEQIKYASEHRERTREKVTTYFYYQWGAWSDWKDGTVQPSDDLEVDTRTLYRYKSL